MAEATEEARILAEQYDIDLSEVRGTGPGGLITLEDVEAFIRERFFPKVERVVRVSGIRKVIAENLSRSYRSAVHVTEFTEVDASALREFRARVQEELGRRIPYTAIILKCVADALLEHRGLNATLEGDEYRIYRDVNINVAVDTPYGLVAPVLRNVDRKGLAQVADELEDVAERARAGTLKEKDFVGGTFTVTNLGMLGVDGFTPIINPPQVAILGVGRMAERPVAVGGRVEVRPVMVLSLSFDHRVVDGAPAARFLAAVADRLARPGEVVE